MILNISNMVLQNLQFLKTTSKSDDKKKSLKEPINDEGTIIYDELPHLHKYNFVLYSRCKTPIFLTSFQSFRRS